MNVSLTTVSRPDVSGKVEAVVQQLGISGYVAPVIDLVQRAAAMML